MKVSYPQIILGTAEIVQLRLWLAKIGWGFIGLGMGQTPSNVVIKFSGLPQEERERDE